MPTSSRPGFSVVRTRPVNTVSKVEIFRMVRLFVRLDPDARRDLLDLADSWVPVPDPVDLRLVVSSPRVEPPEEPVPSALP